MRQNEYGQPIGPSLKDWGAPLHPPKTMLAGQYCQVVPVDVEQHAQDLYQANSLEEDASGWTYLPYGPFASLESYIQWLTQTCLGDDPQFYAIIDRQSGQAVGLTSYLRITPEHGVIEIGHLKFSPRLSRTTAATESLILMIRHAFDLGYRRCEWKCDAFNVKSRAAAERLGFIFEGVFRQVIVYRDRSRDTAWYAIIDQDWPRLVPIYEQWLDPKNFTEEGQQRIRLSALMASLRVGE
ncbi:MAG: GNAT family protein [Chloroflexota bacterium]